MMTRLTSAAIQGSLLAFLLFLVACSEQISAPSAVSNNNDNDSKQQNLIRNQLMPRVVGAWSTPTTLATELVDKSQNGYFIGPISQALQNEQFLQWRVEIVAQSGELTTVSQQRTVTKFRESPTSEWQDNAPTDQLTDRLLRFPKYFRSPQGVLYALWHRNGSLYFSFKQAGQNWEPEVKIAAGSWGHIAFDDQDNAAIFWSHPILAGLTHINARMYQPGTGWISNLHALEQQYPAGTKGLPLSNLSVTYSNNKFHVVWSDNTGPNQDQLRYASLDSIQGWPSEASTLTYPLLNNGEHVTTLDFTHSDSLNENQLVIGITNTQDGERRVLATSQKNNQWTPATRVDEHDTTVTTAKTLAMKTSMDDTGISIAWVEQQQADTETYQIIKTRSYAIDSGWNATENASPARLTKTTDPAVTLPDLQIKDFNIAKDNTMLGIAWVEATPTASELHTANKTGTADFTTPQLIYTSQNAMAILHDTQLSITADNAIMISWVEEIPAADGIEYRVMAADYQGGGNTVTPTPTPPAPLPPEQPAAAWTATSEVWTGSLFATSEAVFVGPTIYINETTGQNLMEFQFGGQFSALTGDFGATESFILVDDGTGSYADNSPIPAADEGIENVGSAIDAVDGNIYFIWSVDTDLKLATFSGGAWNAPTVINNGDKPVYARIGANPIGGAVVFWASGTRNEYQYNGLDISAGGTPGTAGTKDAAVFDIQEAIVNQEGELYVASLNGDIDNSLAPRNITLHRFTAGSWSEAKSELTSGEFEGLDLLRSNLQLATAATGRIVVVLDAFIELSQTNFRRNIYSNWINFSIGWDEWNNIDFNLGFPNDRIDEKVQVANNNNGTVIVAWAEKSIDPATGDVAYYVLASQYESDHHPITLGHWGPPIPVSSTAISEFGTSPAVAVSEAGDAIVVWLNYNVQSGAQDLYSNVLTGDTWGPADEVIASFNSATDGMITSPSINISPGGLITVGWLQTTRQLFSRDYQVVTSTSTF